MSTIIGSPCMAGKNCGPLAVCGSDDICGAPKGSECPLIGADVNDGCAAPYKCISERCSEDTNKDGNTNASTNAQKQQEIGMIVGVVVLALSILSSCSAVFMFLRRRR